MRGIVKASRRTSAVRPRDRNGGFPQSCARGLSGSPMLVDGARGLRCRGIATPRAPGRKPWEAVSMSQY